MSIQDRVVIMTGATGGLGQVAAGEFARHGARLVLVGRGKETLAALAATLDPTQERVLTHAARLTEPEAAGAVAEATMRQFGRIDVLLHLVGGWIGGKSIGELDPRETEPMLQQHLWTTVHLARAAVPHMRRGGWGRVIAVSSPTASNPGAERAPYAIGTTMIYTHVLNGARPASGVRRTGCWYHQGGHDGWSAYPRRTQVRLSQPKSDRDSWDNPKNFGQLW